MLIVLCFAGSGCYPVPKGESRAAAKDQELHPDICTGISPAEMRIIILDIKKLILLLSL